jgi:hypothetical protein
MQQKCNKRPGKATPFVSYQIKLALFVVDILKKQKLEWRILLLFLWVFP